MAERAHPEDPGFKGNSIYKKKMMERYEWANQYIHNKDVLDIPCGCGWGTYCLTGYKSCIGIDIDAPSIEYAERCFKKTNCEFMVWDMANFRPQFSCEQFDVIVCLEGYEHIEQKKGILFLEQAKILLRPGGLLLLTCPVIPLRGKHSGNPYHLYEPNEIDFIMIVNSRFRILSAEWQPFPDNPIYRVVLQRR